ncbi:ATP-binding cassette domain-containing protein [Lachnospiraceae bacterium ZAX-1]
MVSKGVESVKSVGDIIADDAIEPNNSVIPLETVNGSVEFINVDYKYPNMKKWIIEDFNLKVQPGETIAFVGESGAGKSTIFNLLIGFIPPVNGKILIDRINMVNLDVNEYRRHIAVVPQQTILFSGSLRDNITYGLTGVRDEEIVNVIKEVRLDDLINSLKDGLNTQLGEHGDKLSGGQKQRVSIARAIIRKPKIIVFDEATSALDSISEKRYKKQRIE